MIRGVLTLYTLSQPIQGLPVSSGPPHQDINLYIYPTQALSIPWIICIKPFVHIILRRYVVP